jgi:hypothetical protein
MIMMKKISSMLGWLGLVVLCGTAGAADAPDPCSQFSLDVSHELAMFGHQPVALTAGKDAAAAPMLVPDQLYELTLTPQADVGFAHPPSKRALNDGAYAGLARVRIITPGIYRVAIDGPFWIDVLSHGTVLPSGDFAGAHGCTTLAKLVEFRMPAGELLLQLSGAGQAQVRVAVTPSPKP